MGGLAPQEQEQGEDPVWVISPKFECPVLNFSGNAGPEKGTTDASLTATQKACFDSQGMWYGSGSIPKGADGIIMGLSESFPDDTFKPTSTKKSLLKAVGFNEAKRKIGNIASNKKNIQRQLLPYHLIQTLESFSRSIGTIYDTILKNIKNGDPDVNLFSETANLVSNIEETSVGNMIRKMSKYVIPPFLDFRNPELLDKLVNPFAMYIMEFEHNLDQEDLQNIWQNVMPKIAKTAKKYNITISHQVCVPWEFFSEGIPRKIKFKIFKVKKRAKNNYFNLTPNYDGEKDLQANGEYDSVLNLGKGFDLPYSYNWPYDFSLLLKQEN